MKRLVTAMAFGLLVACGGTAEITAPSTTVPSTSHPDSLHDRESADLAAQLTPVAGHSYRNLPTAEIDAMLSLIDRQAGSVGQGGRVSAISFHGIVADDPGKNRTPTASGGREVGLLTLMQLEAAPPAGAADDPDFFARFVGVAPTRRLAIWDVAVFGFLHADRPDSSVVLMWLRHGVLGSLDGAEAEPLETWLAAYLAVVPLSPSESGLLAARLAPVPGFAYTNFTVDEMEVAATKTFPGAPRSIHKVGDAGGTFATITLVEVSDDGSGPHRGIEFARAMVPDLGPRADVQLGGVEIAVLDAPDLGAVYVWASGGVIGVLAAQDRDAAVAFLSGLFAQR